MTSTTSSVISTPTLCSRCQIFSIRTDSPTDGEETPSSPTYTEQYDTVNGLRLFPSQWGDYHDYELEDAYPAFPVLAASIQSGCRACAFVKHALTRETRELIANKKLSEVSEHTWIATRARVVGQHSPTVYLQFELREDENCVVELRFVMRQRRRRLQVSNLRKDPSDLDALSERDVNHMKQWLRDCDSHGGPCSAVETDFKPTRLLDVSGPVIRLIETQNYSPLTRSQWRYIALSYCWGPQPFLKTTVANFAQHLECIAEAALPKAFLDLAKIARALDVPYLWIDCLCITQDDEADWLAESSQMTDVYSNAYLTVVPLVLSSPLESFIESRLEASIPVPFASQSHADLQGDCYLRWSPSTTQRPLLADISRSTWRYRGWTLQESLSARRILYFGQLNYYLQCGTRVIYESGEFPPLASWFLGNMASLSVAEIYDRWLTTIEDYTTRRLTFATDKLQAVASLASLVQRHVDDVYIAGSWSKDVPYGLLWRRKEKVLSKRAEYIAPTWSWASSDGPVYWPLASDPEWLYEMQCADFDLTVKHRQHEPFGPVDNCKLRMSGKVAQVNFAGDHEASARLAADIATGVEITGVVWDFFDHSSLTDRKQIAALQDVWLLLVCQKRESSETALSSQCGLVLRRITGVEDESQPLSFERIGYFDTNPLAMPLHQAYYQEHGRTLGDLRKSCDKMFAGIEVQRVVLV